MLAEEGVGKATFGRAIRDAIWAEMARDSSVVCWGEDIKGGTGGDALGETEDAWPGVMASYEGLAAEFGPRRVRDMPIAEAGFMGAAFGAAAVGLRPVVDLSFIDFLGICLDQIANEGARAPYMTGNQLRFPVVVHAVMGAGLKLGGQHSGIHYSVFAHFPGLKVVAPSTPHDAKGLMISAIRDDNPVVFCAHRLLMSMKGSVLEGSYEIPIGRADLKREGTDVTLVAASRMVHVSLEAAERLAGQGISAAVLDLRSLSPVDDDAILAVLEATGRLVVVDEDNPVCSTAATVASIAAGTGFSSLRGPVEFVTALHAPVPFSPPLEEAYLPSVDRIVDAAHRTLRA